MYSGIGLNICIISLGIQENFHISSLFYTKNISFPAKLSKLSTEFTVTINWGYRERSASFIFITAVKR